MRPIGLIALVLVSGLLVFALPLVDCPDCGGEYARTLKQVLQHESQANSGIGCPRCGLIGSVTLWNSSIRRPLDKRLSALIRGFKGLDDDRREREAALASLLGMRPITTLKVVDGVVLKSPQLHSAHFVNDATEIRILPLWP